MSSAHVQSLQHLADFQAALASFAPPALEALSSIQLELRRTHDWLEAQLKHWQAEIRRAEEKVFLARQELARRRLMRTGDRPVDCTEQEVALARAQQRLAWAEEKRDRTRHWLRELPDAVSEYDGQANPLQHLLESGLPRMLAFLDRKLDLLESYLHNVPPTSGESS